MSNCGCERNEAASLERKTLRVLLGINAAMFVLEAITGWFGQSTGLIADSLDMAADASVYGIALGLGVLIEVLRRYFYGSEPISELMIVIGAIALAANVFCLFLMAKHRNGGVHMRASWIFSKNDVIANLGVIASGALVLLLENRFPDLIIGAVISTLVVRGGIQILSEAKHESANCETILKKEVA